MNSLAIQLNEPAMVARDASAATTSLKQLGLGNSAMWDTLGFSKSPYDANPLQAVQNDVDLLIGRKDEAVAFATIVESDDHGAVLLSGLPGVGKTSFFNVQQYEMNAGQLPFGKNLLPATMLCPISSGDNITQIALRILFNACRNVFNFCNARELTIPDNIQITFDWLNGKNGAGLNLNLSAFGFGGGLGRTSQTTPSTNASFEMLQQILGVLALEVVDKFDVEGIFVALDNFENLEDAEISEFLMTFRDTLFTLPKVWWVIIGQTGLNSLVQVLDPRVAERMSGSVELSPISAEELHTAIDRRVKKFHSAASGKAPLTQDVHDFLYDASLGEIRFVFNYASKICLSWVSKTRTEILNSIPDSKINTTILAKILGEHMVNNQIPSATALEILRDLVKREMAGLGFRPKELEVLKKIGANGTATQSDFKIYGLGSGQDFSSSYLSKLYKQHLLAKRQEGRRVHYSLRGIAAIAGKFDLFDEVK